MPGASPDSVRPIWSVSVPTAAVMAASAVMQGSRGGVDLPSGDVDRVKSHLAKYYAKMGDTAPWDRDDSKGSMMASRGVWEKS